MLSCFPSVLNENIENGPIYELYNVTLVRQKAGARTFRVKYIDG